MEIYKQCSRIRSSFPVAVCVTVHEYVERKVLCYVNLSFNMLMNGDANRY